MEFGFLNSTTRPAVNHRVEGVRRPLTVPAHVRASIALAVLLLAAAVAVRAQDAAAPAALAHVAAGPVQPLPYSHKQHLALGLACAKCHTNPDAGRLMTYPPTSTCMTCHATIAARTPALQKLAEYAASPKPIPWVRVYQLPDFVIYWKHSAHLQAGIACVDCHGPVPARDVIAVETTVLTMPGCVTCHDTRQTLTDCGDCHEPRQ